MGGGSGPEVPNIETRSIGDVYGGAVDASINQLPRLLQAFSQYGPGYAKTLADIFIQNQSRQREAYPEKYAVLQPLSESLSTGLRSVNTAGGQYIPETLRTAALNNIRAGQAARGMAESPVSALSEAQYLGGLSEDYRSNLTNQSLQFLNTSDLLVPGSTIDMGTLGLTPASPTALAQLDAQMLEPLRVENEWSTYSAEMDAWARAQARKRALGGDIGAMTGMAAMVAAAPFTGGASLAFLPAAGKIGQSAGQAGGTFF